MRNRTNVSTLRYNAAILTMVLLAGGCSVPKVAVKPVAVVRSTAGNAHNLRILTDSTPDWSSRENFVASTLAGWSTDHEKALALFRWSYLSRRVGGYVVEDSRAVHDPILFFNSYGITQCGPISAINMSLYEAAGYESRCVDLNLHVVAEVMYGGKWHMFDHDFCNYFLDAKGEVAGALELFEGRERRLGAYYLYDNCPTASAPGGRVYMGPSSATLASVASDWYKVCHPRQGFTGGQAGHRYVLGIRPNESYVRYWQPTGRGSLYSRPLNNKLSADPATADGSLLMNSRANGQWNWKPDLSDTSVLFASENVLCTPDGLRVENPAAQGKATFHIPAANVITSVRIRARSSGKVLFTISGNGGVSWTPVKLESKDGVLEGIAEEAVAGRVSCLIKAVFSGHDGLDDLEILTTTQINQRTLPALRLGRNNVVAASDENLEYVILAPRLTAEQHTGESYRASGWLSVTKPGWTDASIQATNEEAELVLLAETPRDIKHLRLKCTAKLPNPAGALTMDASYDNGRTWRELGVFSFKGVPYDIRQSVDTTNIPAGTRKALLRYRAAPAGNGLVSVVAEAGYESARARGAYDVTYTWEEFNGAWVKRSHTQRITDAFSSYTINVGGRRPPRMTSVEVSAAGKRKTGYSDGIDEAVAANRPGVILKYGNKISTGAKYTVSRGASVAFPDVDSKLLTDGVVGLASYWGLDNINFTGKKNEKRVGELAAWESGDDVVVTLDLGQLRKVGGARICAVQPNTKVLYPEKMLVEVSADGKTFSSAGEVSWEECFFPSADFLHWEGFDSPLYDHLPACGIMDFKFPVILKEPVDARHVRFRLKPRVDSYAGIALWELEVYDSITANPWSDRIVLPKPAAEGTKTSAR
ncbi:MAG: hypothetical protein C0404_01350 [Verrucomicrobia bacterium]|nr:hypothetical protein [Verrucomicrobiota bacterium]